MFARASTSWRIYAPETLSGWAWDVSRVKFYGHNDAELKVYESIIFSDCVRDDKGQILKVNSVLVSLREYILIVTLLVSIRTTNPRMRWKRVIVASSELEPMPMAYGLASDCINQCKFPM